MNILVLSSDSSPNNSLINKLIEEFSTNGHRIDIQLIDPKDTVVVIDDTIENPQIKIINSKVPSALKACKVYSNFGNFKLREFFN